MLFSASNKEEIVSLQRFLEAQEREEKVKKNHQKLALWRKENGARRRSLRWLRHGARKRRLAPARGKNPIN
jgi:hypothetical protein